MDDADLVAKILELVKSSGANNALLGLICICLYRLAKSIQSIDRRIFRVEIKMGISDEKVIDTSSSPLPL